ncbi:disintegrin and metalloproteinase domain-containing protein 29-like isoform X2 [Hemicordylus capensis]|uniref:disintegrin and metalloproteinase domain-containing protein 29-like isoform X2 n=1 Tax=Hemicordylus capensis TaxID=884348 RepID=UPI0023025F02|nr:disintegrin and metalloproteinase domain-containing protein 29-like isoform X2 [Hemicordylus capensis]
MLGSGALLRVLLLLLFSPGFLETSKYLYSEVIVPKLLRQQPGFHTENEVSYLVQTEGINRIIHLQQQYFIIRNMPVYYLSVKGDRRVEHPYIRDDCFYSGQVENTQDSDVILSTCTGLWGYIQVGSLKYEIRPVENSSAFQHLIYRTAPEQQEPCQGNLADQDQLERNEPELRPGGDTRNPATEPSYRRNEYPGGDASAYRYLEYYAVCDQSMYQWEKNNETRVILLIFQIMSIVHNIYDDVDLLVILVGIELWTKQDYSPVSETLDKTLEGFHGYAAHELRHHVHFDHACLFTFKGKDFGKSWGGRFCLYNHASISAVKASSSATNDGVSAAHKLGHSIGFVHDDLPGQKSRRCDCDCTAKPGHCLMFSGVAECHRLSNCSKDVYYEFLEGPGTVCLLNRPHVMFEMKTCGNGIVEGDEECDCGRTEACRKNGCCLESCTLKTGTECLRGPCCDKCQFAQEGRVCREPASECDLPEYCSGTSEECPSDMYIQDGMPCGTRENCYMGKCLNLHQHCKNLFGPDATEAPLSCYKELNTRGDQTGNCGQDRLGYKKCREEDVLCGRIQCTNIERLPRMASGQALVQTPVGGVLCWSTKAHEGEDAGAIKDGSSCGAGKICINRSCVELEVLNFDCNFSKCHNRGVCNNHRNCHCTYGWAPPNCTGRGYGGSIDSGPPPERKLPKRYLLLGSMIGVAFLLMAVTAGIKDYLAGKFSREIGKAYMPSCSLHQESRREKMEVLLSGERMKPERLSV